MRSIPICLFSFTAWAPCLAISMADDSELRDAWNSRTQEYPSVIISWRGTYEVNVGQEIDSPFGEPQDTGSGIKTFKSDYEKYWIRGPESKTRVAQIMRDDGEYSLAKQEMNYFEGKAKTMVDEMAQGWVRPDRSRPMCHHHAYQLLQICYRPTATEFHEQIASGAVNYVGNSGSWGGRQAHVYAARVDPEVGKMEHYFNADGYYLGYLSRSGIGTSTLEIELEKQDGKTLVREAVYTELSKEGQLNNKHTFSDFRYEFDGTISDDVLDISFPKGFLVRMPDESKPEDSDNESHIVVDSENGLERLTPTNRQNLDPRVSRAEDSERTDDAYWIATGIGVFCSLVVIAAIVIKKRK